MAYDLTDKVVFITGASRGIGRACAAAYHGAGARIVAAARTRDRLEALRDELGAERVLAVTLDVTSKEQRRNALEEAVSRFGPVDVLVNNAGWASFGSVEKMPADHVEQMVTLNFLSVVGMTQAVLPQMLARGEGQIVNVASVVGFQPIPRMTVYCATKAALVSFSDGLRMELAGTGVDVITIAPSSTRTDFFDAAATVDVRTVRLAKTQYTPQRVAKATVRASRRRRRTVILSVEGKTIALIHRAWPGLADAIMVRFARRTMPQAHAIQAAARSGRRIERRGG